jgi:type I restriction enzyme S subunit
MVSAAAPALRRVAQGTTFEAINKTDLASLMVMAPPQTEREPLGFVLDTLDTTIRQTEAIIEKLKQVKQGLLHDLLTRGIGANGELRPPHSQAPHLYKDSALGWIPKEWEVRCLSECAEISSGVTLGRELAGHGVVELPYLRVANVQDGYVDLREVKSVRVLRSEIDRYALSDGDVLMNEGGDFDKLGRGTVWRAQIQPCLHQNHVFRVRCNRDMLLPDFLAAYSASQRGKTFFLLSSKQSTNLASINSTQLKGFPIARPGGGEQRQIVERIHTVDCRVCSESRALQKLEAIKSGLMDDLLTGRVRVTPLLA